MSHGKFFPPWFLILLHLFSQFFGWQDPTSWLMLIVEFFCKKKFFFSRTFFIYQMKKAFEKGWKSRKIHYFLYPIKKKHQTHHIKKCFCDQALLQTLKYVVYHVLQTIKCILYYMAKNGQILSWWYGFFKLSNIYKSLDKL